MKLYIDIETIPSQKDDALASAAEGITPPGTMKKAETIEKWEKEQKPGLIDKEWRKTALNGTQGEIICIGWAIDDNETLCRYRGLDEPESDLLETFFDELKESLIDRSGYVCKPTWVGHNISAFDLRFIWQRCVINNVFPSVKIPYDSKPWSDDIFDTLIEWTGFNKSGGALGDLCKAFGAEGKGDIDGSKVWDYVKAGKIKEVADYCKDDVEKTRMLYKRMNFIQ